MKSKKIKIALVCTKGGHFEQLTNLSDFYDCYEHFWITNENKQTRSQLENEKKYYVETAHFKKPWTYLYQLPKMMWAFALERPTHVLSTGSGRTAFIPFLLSKLLRKKFLFIDTFSRVNGYSKASRYIHNGMIVVVTRSSISGRCLRMDKRFKKSPALSIFS